MAKTHIREVLTAWLHSKEVAVGSQDNSVMAKTHIREVLTAWLHSKEVAVGSQLG